MKKIMTLLTMVCLAVFVAGCGSDTTTEDGTGTSTDDGHAATVPGDDGSGGDPADTGGDPAGGENKGTEENKSGDK